MIITKGVIVFSVMAERSGGERNKSDFTRDYRADEEESSHSYCKVAATHV